LGPAKAEGDAAVGLHLKARVLRSVVLHDQAHVAQRARTQKGSLEIRKMPMRNEHA